MMVNQLGRDLQAHRQSCSLCSDTAACDGYLGIAREAIAKRVVREGPRMGHTRLSIQEAEHR